jgi:hypothetical protein
MIIWIDAQLSPALAPWIETTFGVEARALRELGLRDATDRQNLQWGKAAGDNYLLRAGSQRQELNHIGEVLWLPNLRDGLKVIDAGPH